MIPAIGVDPGGSETGIVVRAGDVLVAHWLIRKASSSDYRRELLGALDAAVQHATQPPWGPQPPALGIESVQAPNPHATVGRPINVTGLLRTGEVIGWLQQAHATQYLHLTLVMVTPGQHGAAPLYAYPGELVGARERSGTGQLRHVRSAWDIAAAAAFEAALRRPPDQGRPVASREPMSDETPAPSVPTPEEIGKLNGRIQAAKAQMNEQLAEKVAACRAGGYTVPQIVKGSGISRAWIYRLLKTEDDNGDGRNPRGTRESTSA